jgi:L-ascorbate metabolism protein UlaG (beta-lactamase superfamily)
MDITYLGHSSFLLKSKEAKVVTDPFGAETGMKFPKLSADIVTVSHGHFDHNNVPGVDGEPRVFNWPGEYEKNGVRVFGFQSYHDDKKGEERGENVIFKFEMEGIHIVHLGDLGHKLSDGLIEDIGDVDILMIPTGGHYTINSAEAAEVVKQIDPSIVIPMHYATDAHSAELREQLEPVDTFLQRVSVQAVEPIDKLSIKKEDLTGDDLKVIVMKVS